MPERARRVLGVDYGRRRIGLAVGDLRLRIASPLDTLKATGRAVDDARIVLDRARAEDVSVLVVGLPLNMDGSVGPQAELTRTFIAALRAAGAVNVIEADERLSSFAADEAMRAGGLTRRRPKAGRRDRLAAQAILQGYFDSTACDFPTK